MAKVQALLLLMVAVFPFLNGYPLEETPSSSSSISSDETKPHDLKVNPLLSGQIQQQKNDDASTYSDNKDDSNSTENTFIEETYIEVLLPGTAKLNSSVLESLFNATSASRIDEADRLKRYSTNDKEESNTSSKKEEGSSTSRTIIPALYTQQGTHQARPARDTSSENDDNSKDDSSEEKSQSSSPTPIINNSTVEPVLYSAHSVVKRESSEEKEDSSSNEDSSDASNSNSAEIEQGSSTSRSVVPALYIQQGAQVRPARDTSSEYHGNSKEDSSETSKSSSPTSPHTTRAEPLLYSSQRVKRESDRKEDNNSSNEHSSEEKENKTNESTGILSTQSSTSQSSNRREVRETTGKVEQSGSTIVAPVGKNTNIHNNRNTEEKQATSSKSGSTTETVVFITPQAKKL